MLQKLIFFMLSYFNEAMHRYVYYLSFKFITYATLYVGASWDIITDTDSDSVEIFDS